MRSGSPRNSVLRFLVGGGTATLLNLCLLWILINKAGLWYLGAAVLSYSLSTCYNFALQRVWAFDGTQGALVRQFPLFAITSAIGLSVNSAFLFTFVEISGISPVLSQAVASSIVSFFSFFAYRRIFVPGVELSWALPRWARL